MKCSASIYFDVAPYIEIGCARISGHGGSHEATRGVYDEPRPAEWRRDRHRTTVGFTWADPAPADGGAS